MYGLIDIQSDTLLLEKTQTFGITHKVCGEYIGVFAVEVRRDTDDGGGERTIKICASYAISAGF